MPSCTPPCLLFRPCRNFSVYVGIFLTRFHFQGGIFPTMSEFLPIPILYARKNLLLVDGRAPRSIWCKKSLWVAVKICLLLLRDSSIICKAIFRKGVETFSFFYSVTSSDWLGRAEWPFGTGHFLSHNTLSSSTQNACCLQCTPMLILQIYKLLLAF